MKAYEKGKWLTMEVGHCYGGGL